MPISPEALNRRAIAAVENYLSSLSLSESEDDRQKAKKLAYWLQDYIYFLGYEREFQPSSLVRYRRGQIVKVHLGFNVGNEQGGLHYAVVVENSNSMSSGTVVVVPLTSLKASHQNVPLHPSRVYLGSEIFDKTFTKAIECTNQLDAQTKKLTALIDQFSAADMKVSSDDISRLKLELDCCERMLANSRKIKDEVFKMKVGSLALVGQITTISKIRIRDPRTPHDVLSDIRLSEPLLNDIDAKIKEMFTK